MIGANELTLNTFTRFPIDGVAIDLSVAIHHPILSGEVFPFGMNVESVLQLFGCTKLATEVFVIDMKTQLISVGGVVLHPIVDVVVGNAGAGAEGYLPAEVGEEVEAVVMVVLGDGEVAV